MATEPPTEEFVTIVPVGDGKPVPQNRDSPAFVTVLTVGASTGAAEIVVNRPRGARLGLGLKFEGGSAAAEKVRRLLVQSCAEDSPAANTSTPWGKLIPGDEILAIDGVSVSELTRIDCVRRLKDSDENLTLSVRHDSNSDPDLIDNVDSGKAQSTSISDIRRPTSLPPPVPPRKLGKKNSFKDKAVMDQNGFNSEMLKLPDGSNGFNNKLSRKSSFDSHLLRQNKESLVHLKRGSPEEARRLVRQLSDGKTMPPEAEVYIDLLSTEWERCLAMADAESDDTGSSISTVVDRFGSMTSSVENSIPSTPIMPTKTIDIQKVLNCIENIDSDILNDMTTNKIMEKRNKMKEETRIFEVKSLNGSFKKKDKFNLAIKEEARVDIYETKENNNDKNNNNAVSSNVTCINFGLTDMNLNGSNNDSEHAVIEKPKPMPRNSKIERSFNDVNQPDIVNTVVPEALLTPTKKNCIETWLLRSEAELKSTNDVKIEDIPEPEALPRLIDFVPKPQFKECESSPTVAVPCSVITSSREVVTPASPLPTETREDGSGASLDTIGELDETNDSSIDTLKITNDGPVIETKARKSSYESGFWEDRVNKSDAEDKSLSNDETPPPSCPRQPPDGIENPLDVTEKPSEVSGPTRLTTRPCSGWTTTRTRLSYSRMQDARSEASVKDKIAMFSTDRSSCDQLDKCGTLPTKTTITNNCKSSSKYDYSEGSLLDKRLTKSQDNLDEVPRGYNRNSERPDVLEGGLTRATLKTTREPIINSHKRILLDTKPFYYGSTTSLASSVDSCFSQPIYHSRTSSDENNKGSHKSNLEYLIEQRKKSMSKLRNLMIPDSKAPIVDLPEIKVQDALVKTYLNHSTRNSKLENNFEKQTKTKSSTLNDSKWRSNILSNNIPKYSPAFKRKSLQVYSPTCLSKENTPERKIIDKIDLKTSNSKNIPSKPPRLSLDVKHFERSLVSSKIPSMIELSKKSNKEHHKPQHVDIKICTITDIVDSDNDSAMSSTQSSYRSSASSPLHNLDSIESDCSRLSPRVANFTFLSPTKNCMTTKISRTETASEEYLKINVSRSISSDTNISLSSSAGSAATSGSQASCSSLESSVADNDKKKNGKVYDIDTINRRNILASAKCRSGRDVKLNSPVLETKFSHGSYERSPSPDVKLSNRLTTLTPAVSAVANKGENRRRNKVVAETDSDSDSEVNVRQRKYDFKNARLKKTSNIVNKPKQNDINLEISKIEEAPKAISERIIKEIKKAGLDNYSSVKSTSVIDKINGNTSKISKSYARSIESVEKPITINTTSIKKQPKPELVSEPTQVTKVARTSNSSTTYHLNRGTGSGVGLILAGGIDCEAKDVTIHRVLADSVADRVGLKKGARVLSINGCTMNGLTHAQSVAVLKDQRPEITIEIDNDIRGDINGSEKAERPNAISSTGSTKCGSVVTVVLEKAGGGAGLGFGLDGGRDSPLGDRPLTIKKLFAGGSAACSGKILVGAVLLSAGGQLLEGFTRTQAWAALKALPPGPVTLVLKNPEP